MVNAIGLQVCVVRDGGPRNSDMAFGVNCGALLVVARSEFSTGICATTATSSVSFCGSQSLRGGGDARHNRNSRVDGRENMPVSIAVEEIGKLGQAFMELAPEYDSSGDSRRLR